MAMATFTTTKEQDDILSYFEANFGPEAHAMFIDALAGTGKCLGENTAVLLYDGRVRAAQDIEVGDLLMGPDSKPRRVLSTNVGYGPLYKITPVKGSPWVCNDVHVMTLMGTNHLKGKIIDIPLNEFLSGVHPNTRPDPNGRIDRQWKLFRVGVEFEDKPLEIEPYLAGLWIGDGTTTGVEFTNQDEAVINYLIEVAPKYGAHAYITANNGSEYVKRIALRMGRRGQAGRHTPSILRRVLLKQFRDANGEKDIPEVYLINSRQKRLELLAGIIDTDGYYDQKGKCYEITTKYSQLVGCIMFLAQSLGFSANGSQKPIIIEQSGEKKTYYRITICGNVHEIPCRISYKQAVQREQIKDVLVTGWSAEPIGNGHYYGFTLDGDGRFLLGDFTVTHNTSTLVLLGQVVKRIQDSGKNVNGCMIAFNKVIAKALKTKLAEFGVTGIEAKTTNSLGNSILTEAASNGFCPKQRLEIKKYNDLVFRHINKNKGAFGYQIPKGLVSHLTKMVKFARLTFIEPTEENLLVMVDHYGIEIDITSPLVWNFAWKSVKTIIDEGVQMFRATGVLDFDDQIFLPLALDLTAPVYDLICSDEAQDFNSVRLQLTQRCIKPTGFLVYVGDANQAMQGFAGADTNSVQNIVKATNAKVLPLSVCWRCDANIIRVAQALVPRIQARPNAPEGIVDMISASLLVSALEPGYKRGTESKDGDLVLCRVNADLVPSCLECIRNGKYAIIRGRSIGRGIIAFIDQAIEKAHEPVRMSNLAKVVEQAADMEIAALALTKNAEEKIAKVKDKQESFGAFLAGFVLDQPDGGIDDFKKYIETKFSGDDDEPDEEKEGLLPIVFSTVHKAKGLEFDRVFILRPDLMPFPAKNQKDWQVEQEYNILYVAVTRAKHELYFVGGIPTPVQAIVEDIIDDSFSGELATEEEAVAIAESIVAPVVETAVVVKEAPIVATPEPIIVEQAASTPEMRYPVAQPRGKASDKKAVKGVAYNFPPELCDKLDTVAQLILEATGEKFDKSAYVAGRVFGQYLDIDVLIASLQGQDNPPDPDNGGGAPVPVTSHEDEKRDFGPALSSFFNLAIQDAASRGYTVQAVVSTPEPTMPTVAPHSHVETPVLFDSPIDPDKAYRRFYHCGSKFCKHKWGYDYHVDPATNQFYRLDANGKRVTAEEDAKCPKCGNDGKWTKKRTLKATYNPGHRCTASCQGATSDECLCTCNGANHGKKWMLGTPLLKAPTAK